MTTTIIGVALTAFIVALVPELLNNGLLNYRWIIDAFPEPIYYIENTPGIYVSGNTVLKAETIRLAVAKIYGMMGGLVALRFVWKGFKTYVLCRDGDPDHSPVEMLVGTALAIITAAVFPYLYDLGYTIVTGMTNTVLRAFKFSTNSLGLDVLEAIENNTSQVGFLNKLIMAAYTICVFILVLKMLMRGCEMLIYRLGVPLAASGMVEGDGGGWKDYISVLFRMYLSTSVQYICLVFSVVLLGAGTSTVLILAFAFLLLAMNAPALLSQWMPASRPSGAGQIFSTGMHAGVSSVRVVGSASKWIGSFFKKS